MRDAINAIAIDVTNDGLPITAGAQQLSAEDPRRNQATASD